MDSRLSPNVRLINQTYCACEFQMFILFCDYLVGLATAFKAGAGASPAG